MAVAGPADCAGLPELREHVGDCHRCPLGDGRTTLVFGVGDPAADLMFVGEAPGKNEDLQGEPFVGAAGKLLDELLAGIGLTRPQVYIANVLKCRPPGNRDPLPVEVETCTPFLSRQIELVAPKVIATLGNYATRYVLDTTAGISALRGRLYHVDGRRIVPIYHPAVALYDPSKRADLEDDFRRLRVVLDRDEEAEGADARSATVSRSPNAAGSTAGPAETAGQPAETAGQIPLF